jgi:hypothetical protein
LGISLQILPSAGAPSIVGGISTITSGRTRRSIWPSRASATGRALVPIRRACRRSSTATGDIVRKAGKDGDIIFKTRRFRIGKPFRGELRCGLAPRMAFSRCISAGIRSAPLTWVFVTRGPVDLWTSQDPRTLPPLTPDQANVLWGDHEISAPSILT